mmetsp:Transcript_35043/g.68684  ORF Transcript_35043/g.68684 Transcript_35043/m.68684 type:complete len:234 (+) Transcript_35043:240-941(+)
MVPEVGQGKMEAVSAGSQHNASFIASLSPPVPGGATLNLVPGLSAALASQGVQQDAAKALISDPQWAQAAAGAAALLGQQQQLQLQQQQTHQMTALLGLATTPLGTGAPSAQASLKRRRPDSSGNDGVVPGEVATQAAQTQRRKESHNLTEQKRRQRINDKMAELKDILPSAKADHTSDKQAPDKATILSDAIDFIRKLHDDVREAKARKSELEKLNALLKEENQQLKKAASA